ncbi:portal protein [Sphingomonas sp. MMS24-JH45]
MGFERGQVYGLSPHNYTPETTDDQERWWKAESTAALQEVLLCEEYARIDIDDDGIAERVKVFRSRTTCCAGRAANWRLRRWRSSRSRSSAPSLARIASRDGASPTR